MRERVFVRYVYMHVCVCICLYAYTSIPCLASTPLQPPTKSASAQDAKHCISHDRKYTKHT